MAQREKLAVTRHLTRRVAELERELEVTKRLQESLLDIASDKRKYRRSALWAWREVEVILANSFALRKP